MGMGEIGKTAKLLLPFYGHYTGRPALAGILS